MAVRKAEEKNIRKLTRMGSKGKSFGLTLPVEMVRDLGWKERQKLAVKRIKGGMEIRDWKSK